MAIGVPGIGVGLSRGSLEAAVRALFAVGEQGAWYDPADFSTMFQDSAGTTPVTTTGQPVGLIRDKSGRGNHASQATAASRPTLQQDASGFYYLSFDGVDDGMQTTAVDFTATDKMTVLAGVMKLSDAARGMVLELSPTYATAGTFGMTAPDAASPSFGWHVSSSLTWTDQVSAGMAAPYSAVVTGQGNLADPSQAGRAVLRVNGVAQAGASAVSGAGSFTSNAIFIGRRGGTTLPLSGRIYSLIVRGAASSAAQITQAERYVGSRMGIAL